MITVSCGVHFLHQCVNLFLIKATKHFCRLLWIRVSAKSCKCKCKYLPINTCHFSNRLAMYQCNVFLFVPTFFLMNLVVSIHPKYRVICNLDYSYHNQETAVNEAEWMNTVNTSHHLKRPPCYVCYSSMLVCVGFLCPLSWPPAFIHMRIKKHQFPDFNINLKWNVLSILPKVSLLTFLPVGCDACILTSLLSIAFLSIPSSFLILCFSPEYMRKWCNDRMWGQRNQWHVFVKWDLLVQCTVT